MKKVPTEQVAGVFHRRVGDIVVTAISDGYLDGGLEVLRNISQDEARQILADSFRAARRTAVNAFLLYSAGRLALVETGSISQQKVRRMLSARQHMVCFPPPARNRRTRQY